MGVYIKGMEMPVMEMEWTIRHGADDKWYVVDTNAETSDGEWHEIVPVPAHGRLIDADALIADIKEELTELTLNGMNGTPTWTNDLRGMWERLEDKDIAPTIIEAEEEIE